MKKVGIATTFTGFDPAYSLCNVVADQIQMLTHSGYESYVFAVEGFEPEGVYKKATILPLPSVKVYNELKVDETFDEDKDKLYQVIKKHIEDHDLDVILTHDWIYQPDALKHNFAGRKVAKEKENVHWLHWIHSATKPNILAGLRGGGERYTQIIREPWPNSHIVFPNAYSIPRVANNYGLPEEKVKVINHPTDTPTFFGLDKIETRLWKEKKLWRADAIAVAPARLDRGKQIDWVIKIMAGLKMEGKDVRVIVVDFHSTGGDKVAYREEMKQTGIDWGLNPQELTFTSQFDDAWNVRVPRETVSRLFSLSNVFILPSKSETYSLVAQEAALRGNLLVLNKDFPPFRDIYGSQNIYAPFSSNIDVNTGLDGKTDTSYTSEKDFAREVARSIAYHLNEDYAIHMKTRQRKLRSVESIAENQFIPLIEGVSDKISTQNR